MFKNAWFQIHWFVGITAGLVLAVVGLTGGILSFETEIQSWLNRDVRSVEARAEPPLTPAALLAAIAARYPDRTVTALALSSDPADSTRITLAPTAADLARAGQAPAGRGGPRGETRYVNPYDGAVLEGEATRGQVFFRMTRSLHRWLTAGEFGNQQVGKQIVGVSTLLCVVLALSGLYLRWPRRLGDWRSWLTFDWALKGRSFLWHLHAVVGTWALVGFLLMSLTGLYYSYDWYRNSLYSIAGVERPAPRGAGPQGAPQAGPEARAQNGGAGNGERARREAPGSAAAEGAAPRPATDLGIVWTAFQTATRPYGYTTATLTLPQEAGRPVEIRYLDADPAHERANNTITFDPVTGNVLRHERYDDKRTGEKFIASIFPLHSGSFFGLPGVIAYMVASLAMPLFAITGWLLYLDRRKKKRAALAAQSAAGPLPALSGSNVASNTGGESLLLGFASQAGFARQLAWQTAGSLQAAGVNVDVQPLDRLGHEHLKHAKRALFVVSTFGDGEPPDEARSFMRRLMAESMPLGEMKFGLLALGDRQYKTFCEFGHSLDQWLKRQGAQPLFPTVEVDNGDQNALDRWRASLGGLAGGAQLAAWQEPPYGHWRLLDRRLLNAGSVGGATFHLELVPVESALDRWEAGDIAEVQPANPAEAIEHYIKACGLDGDSLIPVGERSERLADLLRYRELPAAPVRDPVLLATLKSLPKREFSIASIPADGSLQLVVRQARHEDGTLGLGSGWLTAHATVGADIRVRIRPNPGFHAPDEDRPLILIGNGTGIAGLRSLIKARAMQLRGRNWLIFGERNLEHDFYYRDEIERWQANGMLERVDLAFSRDQAERIYVQRCLREQADTLRAWLAAGAAVYVCGSLEGMASGVDTALVEIIGTGGVERLAEQGRYRRDVY